jgi:hypothetical protein
MSGVDQECASFTRRITYVLFGFRNKKRFLWRLSSGLENVGIETDKMQGAVRTYLTSHTTQWSEV